MHVGDGRYCADESLGRWIELIGGLMGFLHPAMKADGNGNAGSPLLPLHIQWG